MTWKVLQSNRQASELSPEVLLVQLDGLGRELLELLEVQRQSRNSRVLRHDHAQARRRADVRARGKIFGRLHHALCLRRQNEIDEQHRRVRMLGAFDHLYAVDQARDRVEQHGGRRGAPAGADDRMVRRDTDADPVFAQDDLIDDLPVADRQRRDVLPGELGDIGLGLLCAPGCDNELIVIRAPLASELAFQAILPRHFGLSRSS